MKSPRVPVALRFSPNRSVRGTVLSTGSVLGSNHQGQDLDFWALQCCLLTSEIWECGARTCRAAGLLTQSPPGITWDAMPKGGCKLPETSLLCGHYKAGTKDSYNNKAFLGIVSRLVWGKE